MEKMSLVSRRECSLTENLTQYCNHYQCYCNDLTKMLFNNLGFKTVCSLDLYYPLKSSPFLDFALIKIFFKKDPLIKERRLGYGVANSPLLLHDNR